MKRLKSKQKVDTPTPVLSIQHTVIVQAGTKNIDVSITCVYRKCEWPCGCDEENSVSMLIIHRTIHDPS